jgi:hypothetical protein
VWRRPKLKAVQQVAKLGNSFFWREPDRVEYLLLDVSPASTPQQQHTPVASVICNCKMLLVNQQQQHMSPDSKTT